MEQPDALILTGIGIGTAFGVLVLLLASVYVIRLVTWLLGKWTGRHDDPVEDPPDPEMRTRAAAASVAVTALIHSRPQLGLPDETREGSERI